MLLDCYGYVISPSVYTLQFNIDTQNDAIFERRCISKDQFLDIFGISVKYLGLYMHIFPKVHFTIM